MKDDSAVPQTTAHDAAVDAIGDARHALHQKNYFVAATCLICALEKVRIAEHESVVSIARAWKERANGQ
jgi:hypothetical protein